MESLIVGGYLQQHYAAGALDPHQLLVLAVNAGSALSESGRFNRDAIERQMSHQERNSVRAAYVHKAEYLSERKAIMQWWSDYLSVCQTGRYYLPDEFTGKQDWC